MIAFDIQLTVGHTLINYSVVNEGGFYIVRGDDRVLAVLEKFTSWRQTAGAPLLPAVMQNITAAIEYRRANPQSS